tara:strand:- start:135 stop:320 length:186 start_codon:yes stop_codon:yes gene_type:complete
MEFLTMSQMEFMTEVLSDWCTLENKEFISADDLLFTDNTLSDDQRSWLTNYIELWEVVVNA